MRPEDTIREVAQRMRADNIGSLPVGENDRLIGMVTDRYIVLRAVAEERAASNTTVRQVMSGNVFYCFEDDDIGQAASGKPSAETVAHVLCSSRHVIDKLRFARSSSARRGGRLSSIPTSVFSR
jgi:predicted transcriptional regulator